MPPHSIPLMSINMPPSNLQNIKLVNKLVNGLVLTGDLKWVGCVSQCTLHHLLAQHHFITEPNRINQRQHILTRHHMDQSAELGTRHIHMRRSFCHSIFCTSRHLVIPHCSHKRNELFLRFGVILGCHIKLRVAAVCVFVLCHELLK